MSSSKKWTYKGTLRQVFIRVYRLEVHSVMLVFLIQLYGPSNFLSGSTLRPLSPSWCEEVYCIYSMHSVGGGGVWGSVGVIFCRNFTLFIRTYKTSTQTDKRLPRSPFTGPSLDDNILLWCLIVN
jgi:hypothetical protein